MKRRLPLAPERSVELSIDGRQARVPEGATLLEACRSLGIDVPTLCHAENLTPVNVCRICVVELEGARTLVPSCSRKVEAGMEVFTDSPRVRTARKLVMELLASSVDLSTAPAALEYAARYGAEPERMGPPAPLSKPGEREPPTSRNPPRSTTSSSCATTANACSATSAWRPAVPMPRTPSLSR